MKPNLRLFLISLISLFPVIACNCGLGPARPPQGSPSAQEGGANRQNHDDGGNNSSGVTNTIVNLTVNGMTCPSCKNIVEGALRQVDGVVSAEVTLPQSVKVAFNPKKVDVAIIKKTINDTGYNVVD